jgi:D-3-phosphoglycerate dehydrogenase
LDAPTRDALAERFAIAAFGKGGDDRDRIVDEAELLALLSRERPEVAIIEQEPVTSRVVAAAAPELRLVACVRAAPNNIDLAACRDKGILVTNAPGRNAVAVVEMTIGFMICLARFIPQTHHEIMCRRLTLSPGAPLNRDDILWQHPDLKRNPYILYRGVEIDGRTLGLVGLGIIGRMLAPKAAALGLRLMVCDPYVDAAAAAAVGAEKVGLDYLLANADFVSLHAKVTPETRGMIGRREFELMKPDAYFINTARGALVKQDDLVRILRERRIAGAALDVYDQEPQYHDSPFLELDNVILTPHIGGATKDGIKHQSRLVLRNVLAYLDGTRPPNLVNPPPA